MLLFRSVVRHAPRGASGQSFTHLPMPACRAALLLWDSAVMRSRSFLGKLALSLPLNLLLGLIVFGASPMVVAVSLVCGIAGAWMAYAFDAAFEASPVGASQQFVSPPAREPADPTAFRHRHA